PRLKGIITKSRSDRARSDSAGESCTSPRPETLRATIQALSQHGQPIHTMKKLFCILASAALFAACEQKTETVNTPAASPAEKKTENNTTVVNPPATKEKTKETNTITNTTSSPTAPASSSSSSSSTTTTT